MYLVAQNVHGPRFTNPFKICSCDRAANLRLFKEEINTLVTNTDVELLKEIPKILTLALLH